MVGAVLLGGLADKLGRKQCLIISLAINAAFAFLSSFVQGYGFFLFCRLISGLGWVPGESGLGQPQHSWAVWLCGVGQGKVLRRCIPGAQPEWNCHLGRVAVLPHS